MDSFVEIVVLVVNPFFNDASCQLDVVVIEDQELSAFLLDLDEDVREWGLLLVEREFRRHLPQGAFNL